MKKLLKVCAVAGCIALLSVSYSGAEERIEINSLCELHGEYTDKVNNTTDYSYDLPKVSGSSEYITQINEEIGLLYGRIEHCIGQMETGVSIDLSEVSWRSAKYNDITSIMITENYGGDDLSYHFFNYDKTGNQASKEEILDAAGLTTQEFKDRAYDMVDHFMTRDDMEEKPELKEMWDAARAETLSDNNCNEELPMFLEEDGTLIFCVRCNTVAGAGWHNHLFELSPIHLPQEGELLIEAMSDEHLEHMQEAPPVKVEMWIDRMGDQSRATITDKEMIQRITDAFSNIRIGKEAWEVVTDNYNGLIFSFEDGAEVYISLNLKNLEFQKNHSCQYYELENFGEFWGLMRELTGES